MIDDEHLKNLGSTRVETIAELRRLARSYTGEALRTLLEIMMTSPDHRLKLAAADSLLDRAWGKAPTAVSVSTEGPTENQNPTNDRLEFMRRLTELSQVSSGPRDSTTPLTEDHFSAQPPVSGAVVQPKRNKKDH